MNISIRSNKKYIYYLSGSYIAMHRQFLHNFKFEIMLGAHTYDNVTDRKF